MYLYSDIHGDYWAGSEAGVIFIASPIPHPGQVYQAEVWDFETANQLFDLELVQEAGG